MGGFALLFVGPSEPSFNGRTITSWLAQFRKNSSSGNDDSEARTAILQIGTNSIPTLVRLLRADKSKPVACAIDVFNRLKLGPLHIRSDYEKHMLAAQGFIFLGNKGAAAIPDLLSLTKHPNPDIRYQTLHCMGMIDPKNIDVKNSMISGLNDVDVRTSLFAASFLTQNYYDEARKLGVYRRFPQFESRLIDSSKQK